MNIVFYGVKAVEVRDQHVFASDGRVGPFSTAIILIECKESIGRLSLFGAADKPFKDQALLGTPEHNRVTMVDIDMHGVESIELVETTAIDGSGYKWSRLIVHRGDGSKDSIVLFGDEVVKGTVKVY